MCRRLTLLLALCWGLSAQAAELRIPGLTQAEQDLELALPIGGIVADVLVKEGDAVAAAAPLLRLHSERETLEHQRAVAVHQAKEKLQAAKQREEMLAEQLATTAQLYKEGRSVSREEYHKARLEAELARLDRLRLAQDEKVEALNVELAAAELEQRTLRAPVAGTVTRLEVAAGEAVASGTPVVQLVDTRRLRFVGAIEWRHAGQLKVGQQVRLRIEGAEPALHNGEVSFVSPLVDPASGLVEFKVLIDNADGALRAGTPAELLLDTGKGS